VPVLLLASVAVATFPAASRGVLLTPVSGLVSPTVSPNPLYA
jgi:hypothetical protein